MAMHYFEEDGARSQLKSKRKLSAFLQALIQKYRPVRQIQLNFVFCSDEALLERNRSFLKHDTLTDIITFDLSDQAEVLEAEIYISVERVRENAAKFGVVYNHELHRVIFHGVLHLCGFKDKKTSEKEAMRAAEESCLAGYFKMDE